MLWQNPVVGDGVCVEKRVYSAFCDSVVGARLSNDLRFFAGFAPKSRVVIVLALKA
jgi:hypothetical protein